MTNSTAVTIGGTAVRQVGDLHSLNDLHRASGGDVVKRAGDIIGIKRTLQGLDPKLGMKNEGWTQILPTHQSRTQGAAE